MKEFVNKIRRKLMKLRLQPIRVFCLHHVCKTYDESTMYHADWMQIDEFKAKVHALQQSGVEFISLTEAYRHISNDSIRCKKYAVLTFDDGYASLKEILPWLEEQHIPATLFINGKYLDGKSYRKNPKEQYLTKDEIWELTSPLIEIGSHGWEHVDASKMNLREFQDSVCKNREILQEHPQYVSFYAYTYGKHYREEDEYLAGLQLIPVLVDGADNYDDCSYIQRRLL